jgi:hypothetical protein
MEPTNDDQIGICYECSTKDIDSPQKKVYHCDICNKWFCETHLKPKFPYFVDWDTVFDVQGNPEVKALFHTEYKREGGHPDFVYLRKTIEALEIEEKTRNELIKQAMDIMMDSEKFVRSHISIPHKDKSSGAITISPRVGQATVFFGIILVLSSLGIFSYVFLNIAYYTLHIILNSLMILIGAVIFVFGLWIIKSGFKQMKEIKKWA